jgi:small subunit ribosomal protein S4
MARYTGPRVRISRRFGVPIFGPTKYLERRNYGPGMHGPKSRRKTTDYGWACWRSRSSVIITA